MKHKQQQTNKGKQTDRYRQTQQTKEVLNENSKVHQSCHKTDHSCRSQQKPGQNTSETENVDSPGKLKTLEASHFLTFPHISHQKWKTTEFTTSCLCVPAIADYGGKKARESR